MYACAYPIQLSRPHITTRHRSANAAEVVRSSANNAQVDREYVLRAPPSAPEGTLLAWFDVLVLRLDEIHARPPAAATRALPTRLLRGLSGAPTPPIEAGPTSPLTPVKLADECEDECEEEPPFWRLPDGVCLKLLYLLTFPIAAPIHASTPDARRPQWADWYLLTLCISLVWLIVLATVMATCLDDIGCLIGCAPPQRAQPCLRPFAPRLSDVRARMAASRRR